ncbi:MAG: hypothetical protein Tsb0020_45740 [Haliangiales bacterium]
MLLLLSTLLVGCKIYIGDGGDDGGGGVDAGFPVTCEVLPPSYSLLLRDPDSAACVRFDGPLSCGGPAGCICPPLPPPEPVPSWGVCEGPCSGLEEAPCLASDCRAAYVDGAFAACLETDFEPAPADEPCAGLGALACSRHNDCVAHHEPSTDADLPLPPGGLELGRFLACDDEPPACTNDSQCGLGYICNNDDVCTPPPDCDETGCLGACGGFCVPDPDAPQVSCYGPIFCDAEPPVCQDGSVPAIVDGCYAGGCVAVDDCAPLPPSLSCTGEPTCERLPPSCPNAYVPLIEGDCWIDVCAPVELCE